MHRDELALLGVEVRRAVCSWRFLGVLAVLALFCWMTITQMLIYGTNTGVTYNAWDVFIGLFGNTKNALVSTMFFPALFFFLLGSTVVADVRSSYHLIVQQRLERPRSYIFIKLLAVVITIGVILIVLYVISLVLGVTRGLDLFPAVLSEAGGHPNAWGISRGMPPVYYSLPQGTNVVRHGMLVLLYFIFAYSSVTLFVIGVTARVKSLYTPLAFGALFMGAQLALQEFTSNFVFGLSLATALDESQHRPLPVLENMIPCVPWSQSILVLLAYLAAGVALSIVLNPTRVRVRRQHRRHHASAVLQSGLVMLLFLGCLPLVGCRMAEPIEQVSSHDFLSFDFPQVPEVEVGALSDSDVRYLEQVATITVDIYRQVECLNELFGGADSPRLHESDSEAEKDLDECLQELDADIDEVRSLAVPPALSEWYRLQYEPGIDELQGVVDELSGLRRSHDPMHVWMCLKHVAYADTYLSAAGRSVQPYGRQQ